MTYAQKTGSPFQRQTTGREVDIALNCVRRPRCESPGCLFLGELGGNRSVSIKLKQHVRCTHIQKSLCGEKSLLSQALGLKDTRCLGIVCFSLKQSTSKLFFFLPAKGLYFQMQFCMSYLRTALGSQLYESSHCVRHSHMIWQLV